jgi:hypothetical protein
VSKYNRKIIGRDIEGSLRCITVDVYAVLNAYVVTDPALQHLIKKALCAGLRGHKDTEQDLHDIIDSGYKALTYFKDKHEMEKEQ